MICMRLFIYQIAVHFLILLSPIKFLFRAIKQPAYLNFIFERYGIFRTQIFNKKLIWFHCVSVGETRAIKTLLQLLLEKHIRYDFLITHGTPTGRNVFLTESKRVHRAYLPFDSFILNKRFIRHFKPRIAIFLETEIWPSLLNELSKKKIPSILINARLSKRSLDKYLKFENFSRETFAKFDHIVAQSKIDKDHFHKITKQKIALSSNLKFNQAIEAVNSKHIVAIKNKFSLNNKFIVSLISSRKGEEKIFLDSIKNLDPSRYSFIIVPRHPDRFSEVEKIFIKMKFSYIKMAQLKVEKKSSPYLILGNTMGEINNYIALSDLVFVGGSIGDYGSQNPIEPLLMGKPTVVGQSTHNFFSIIKEAILAKIIYQIEIANLSFFIEKFSESGDDLNYQKNIKTFLDKNKKGEEKVISLISKYL